MFEEKEDFRPWKKSGTILHVEKGSKSPQKFIQQFNTTQHSSKSIKKLLDNKSSQNSNKVYIQLSITHIYYLHQTMTCLYQELYENDDFKNYKMRLVPSSPEPQNKPKIEKVVISSPNIILISDLGQQQLRDQL